MCILKTRSERTAKIVQFFPHNTKVSQVTRQEEVVDAALCLTKAIQNSEHQPLLLTNRKSTYEALKEFSKIFLNRLNIDTPPRVTEKALVLQIRQSPRVAKKATFQNKDNTKKTQIENRSNS